MKCTCSDSVAFSGAGAVRNLAHDPLASAGDGAEEGGLQVVKLQGLRHVSIVYPIFPSSLYQLTL